MEEDPLSDENLPIINFIQLGRIYDVLLAILTDQNPAAARDLINFHNEGNLVGPSPSFSGVFITDEMTEESEE